MNKQSMTPGQPDKELPKQHVSQQAAQQPVKSAGAAVLQATKEARQRAEQNAAGKAGGQGAHLQSARPQGVPAAAPRQGAQPRSVPHTLAGVPQPAVQKTPHAVGSPTAADSVRAVAAQENVAAGATHPAAMRVNAVKEQAFPMPRGQGVQQAEQGNGTAAKRPAVQPGTRLPGMSFSEADTEGFSRSAAVANAAVRPTAPERDKKAALPQDRSAAPRGRHRQAEPQPANKDGGEETQKNNSRKSKRQCKERTISKVAFLALATLAVFLTCGILVFFQLDSFLFGRFEDVEMPNFDGKNVSEIQYNEAYESFHIQYEDVYTDAEPVGIIVEQNPRVPRRVKENATVTLYVSAGVRTVEVPSLTKMTREEAKKALKEAGLNPIFKPITDITAVPDTILKTEPSAGTSIGYGETVQVYFTRSEDSTKIEVPQCVGLATMSEAVRALATAGLNYDLSAESVGDGVITAQIPEAGEMVPRGTKISLTVSGSAATGLDALPQKQLTGADGHTHAYAPSTIVSSNEYSIGYTIYSCSVCNYFYYDDFTQPSAG